MGHAPTPPAPSPEPNCVDNVSPTDEKRSPYWGMDARQTAAAYVKRLRMIKGQSIVLVFANLAAFILLADTGGLAASVLFLALLVAIVFINRVRISKVFAELGGVVSQDCDPARYRAVLDVLDARDRFGRSAGTIAIERAYCDYLELDSASALRRLGSVTFKRKDNPRWFRAMQIEFLSRLDLDDAEGARDTLARLSAFRQIFKEGSRNRAFADSQIGSFTILLRPPAERDVADAALMREHVVLASCHQQRANWQLYLAEYELLHGSAEEARRLAGDVSLHPLTPRMERLRDEILAGLADPE